MDQGEAPTELEEARRVVDAQIETARTYGQRAQTLVRIALTIFGLYASAAVILIQFLPSNFALRMAWPSFGLENIEQRLIDNFEVINEPAAALVVSIPLLAILLIFYNVFSQAEDLPDNVLASLRPSRLQAGISPNRSSEYPVKQYAQIIEKNNATLNDIEERWESLSTGIVQIIGGTTMIFVIAVSLAFGNAGWIAYLTAMILLFGLAILLNSDIQLPDIKSYLTIQPLVDASAFLVFLGLSLATFPINYSISGPVTIIIALLVFVPPFPMMWGYTALESERIRTLSLRNIGATAVSYLLFTVYFYMAGGEMELTTLPIILIAIFVATGISTLVSLMVWFIDLLWRFIGENIQSDSGT